MADDFSLETRRFKRFYEYLCDNRIVRNQQHLAEELDMNRSTISQILNGKMGVSFSILNRITKRFPEINADWIKTGLGDMLRCCNSETYYLENSPGGGKGNIYNSENSELLNKALDEIAQQRALVAKAQSQIDRLLTLLESKN